MRTLRFFVFNFLSWLTVVPWALLVLLVWPVGSKYSYAVARNWTRIVSLLAKFVCGLSWHVEGFENFPDKPCVFFVKHSSAFETYMQLLLLPRSCWVLKKELLYVPFFGWTLIPLKAIAIDRSKGSKAVTQVIEKGKQRLAEGIFVCIFPEGTRMAAGTTRRYGQSGTLLAQAADAVIVPIAHNAGYHWPRRGMRIIPGEVTFVVGKPVDPAGRDPREVNQEIQNWVEKTVADIVAKDRP
jgi:1-acyl-sn-glycerol-3-phosphate acyltransferase